MNLLLFEWKLIVRNKRLWQLFLVSTLLLPSMFYLQLVNSNSLKEFFIKECFLWAVFLLPANLATFIFSINAWFIEKQLIAPLSIYKTVQAKYHLFAMMSILLFILFLPTMFFGIKLIELFAAFVYAIGFGFFGLFLTSLIPSKPFNISSNYFLNYQGIDLLNYLVPFLVILVSVGLMALFYWLFNETITLIAMQVIGIIFTATSNIWLKKISQRFEKTKHRRLECFREN